MSRGKGNAAVFAIGIMLCLVALQVEVAQATIHRVGGANGWTYNVAGWPHKKVFKAGDILSFNYSPLFHNVVAVNKYGYKTCTAPRGAKVYQRGNDRIRLVKGANYFICSFPQHCQSGLKIAIYAQ